MLSQPVVVLEVKDLSTETATVCYINQAFLDMTCTDRGAQNCFVGHRFVDVLQLRLVSPSTPVFLQWISKTVKENNANTFRSQFNGTTKLVNVKWTTVLVQVKYVVLTGRISSMTKLPSQEHGSRFSTGSVRNGDITPPLYSTDSTSSPMLHSTSPVISMENPPTDCRFSVDAQEEPQTTWRNIEKVHCRENDLSDVVYEKFRWRGNDG